MAHASYPLTTEQPYPRRQWWAAATAAEVSRSLMARDILGERVLLYRQEDGTAVAVSGICPHRAFPLEKGRLVGDSVQCGYHGFTFGPDGACQRVPSQNGVPQHAALRRYPVVERGGVVWIWTGEESTADPALLPDLAAHAQTIKSVLKPGGIYYAAIGCHTQNPQWDRWRGLITEYSNVPVQDYSLDDYANAFYAEGFSVSAKPYRFEGFVPLKNENPYFPSLRDSLDYHSTHKTLFRFRKEGI